MVKRSIFFVNLLITCLLLASCSIAQYKCTDPLGCLVIPSGSPVVIGAILATNGPLNPVGTACMDGIAKVVKDKGAVIGHYILLDRYGTDGSPESARAAATTLATDPLLLAVVGPTLSEERLVAMPILSDAGIVSLSPVPDPATAESMAEQILAAIELVAIQRPDNMLIIPRQALWDVLNPPP